MTNAHRIFFTDFDGTLARQDFYQLVLRHATLEMDGQPWEDFLAGRISHFEALRRILAGIRDDATGVDALIDRMEPDPELAEDWQRLQEKGWSVHIVSAGSDWYIHRILERFGLDGKIPVHSNPGRFIEGRGIEIERAADPRIRSDDVGIDKAATLAVYGVGAERIAFAGDSDPDLGAALRVEARDRFARAHLARTLTSRGLPFRRFERWHDVVEALVADD